MSGRGRKPKPTAQKKLEGNPGRRPINTNEPKFDQATRPVAPPRVLSMDGKREWRKMHALLRKAGLLTKVDESALAQYCQAYGTWCEAMRQVNRKGLVCFTPNGSLQVSPWFSIARASSEQCRKFMLEFGLTPSSRSRIVVQNDDDDRPDKPGFKGMLDE